MSVPFAEAGKKRIKFSLFKMPAGLIDCAVKRSLMMQAISPAVKAGKFLRTERAVIDAACGFFGGTFSTPLSMLPAGAKGAEKGNFRHR